VTMRITPKSSSPCTFLGANASLFSRVKSDQGDVGSAVTRGRLVGYKAWHLRKMDIVKNMYVLQVT